MKVKQRRWSISKGCAIRVGREAGIGGQESIWQTDSIQKASTAMEKAGPSDLNSYPPLISILVTSAPPPSQEHPWR